MSPEEREALYQQLTAQPVIAPQDEQAVAPNNVRNSVINYVGLPDSWRQSVADEKRFDNNLPMNMASAGMGTIGNVESNSGRLAATIMRQQELEQGRKAAEIAAQQLQSQAHGALGVAQPATGAAMDGVKRMINRRIGVSPSALRNMK